MFLVTNFKINYQMRNSFIPILVVLMCLFSCSEKNEPIDLINSTNQVLINQQIIKINEGRLAFEGGIDFKNAINSILKDNAEVKGEKFISRSSFVASELKLKSASTSDEVHIDDSDSLVFSDAFCSVLNKDREVQVGNVLIKVTPIGTIMIDINNSEIIKSIKFDNNFLSNCVKITNALGVHSEEDLFENTANNGVYLFDTYSLLKTNRTDQIPEIYKLKSAPIETDFNILSDGKTWAGNIISSIIGFSKGDWKRYNDRDYCVDVKFYSQNFGIYSEAGIKTKTQKQGWTGIWYKVNSDELVCGYDRLILNEKWPAKLFPSVDYIKTLTPPVFTSLNSKLSTYYDLGYSLQKIGDQVLTTRNILGIDIDITNKDVSKALWYTLQPTWKWGNSTFGSGTTQKVAVRTLKDDLINSRIETFDRSIRTTNDDKLTYIFGSDFGFVISTSFNSNSASLKGVEGLAAKFSYENGTVLYGCARRGSEWKGIKLVFD